MKRPKAKKQNLHGLNPANFPKSVAWAVETDYARKLSKSEKQWLATFNDCYHGADFRADKLGTWTTAQRRAAYNQKNAANRDVYTAKGVDVQPIEDNMTSEFVTPVRGKSPGRPAKDVPEDELPVVDAIGWARSPKGWVIVHLKTQGEKVLEKEVLSEPSAFAIAWERLRVNVIHRLYSNAIKR